MKIGKEKIRIRHNKNNRFWKPIGMFKNISEIKINNEWYKCELKFIERDSQNFIQFIHPMKVDEKTLRITEVYQEGIYNEQPVSKFKMNFIKYRLNQHPLNFGIYNFKRTIYERMNSIIVFSFALIITTAFYLVNAKYNNILIDFISKNLWCQTIILFLTLASFINIFYPFSLRKELNKKDVETLSKDTYKKQKEEEKINEEIERITTI
jgi:hypothetical protein